MGDARFGPYVLLERVSVGGMAEVFRARRASEGENGKLLAVKRILPAMIEDPHFRTMFADEANIAGQLVHRNIARIYENGTADSYPYIAMEYVWGKDLLQIQNRFRKLRQRMPVGMACYIVIKVCEALDYAHRKVDAKGKPMLIVHRDCSPQNAIVSYKGEVKLVDFGIARAAERLTMTAAGDVKGKLSYMAPEQVAGAPLDRRVDVYGAGVVLFELLLGDRLISANSEAELIAKARAGVLPRPRDVMPDLDPALEEIILTAVARDPAKRFGWCSELRNALVAYLSGAGIAFDGDELSLWLKGAFAKEMMSEAVDLETLPTYEGQLGPSEFDDRTIAEMGAVPPPSLAPTATASRRMAATISRVDMRLRAASNSPVGPRAIAPQGGSSQPVVISATKVLPRLTVPPAIVAASKAEISPSAAPVFAMGSSADLADPDELEETVARIAVTVAPLAPPVASPVAPSLASPAARSTGASPAAVGASASASASAAAAAAPAYVRRATSIGPAVTATVSVIGPAVTATVSVVNAPRQVGVWRGVAIGVAIAAVVLIAAILVLA